MATIDISNTVFIKIPEIGLKLYLYSCLIKFKNHGKRIANYEKFKRTDDGVGANKKKINVTCCLSG